MFVRYIGSCVCVAAFIETYFCKCGHAIICSFHFYIIICSMNAILILNFINYFLLYDFLIYYSRTCSVTFVFVTSLLCFPSESGARYILIRLCNDISTNSQKIVFRNYMSIMVLGLPACVACQIWWNALVAAPNRVAHGRREKEYTGRESSG
jgi:hypothetical protein